MAIQDVDTLQQRLQKQKGGAKPGVRTMAGGFGSALGGISPSAGGTPEQAAGSGSATAPGGGQTMGGGFNAMLGNEKKTSDVSEVAAEMMEKDNPLMRQARTEGRQSTNSRGLLSSSMTAGESMDSVLKQVVPMASQEAQQRHASSMEDQQTSNRMVENVQKYGQARGLAEQNFGFDTALAEQSGRIAADQSAMDHIESLGLSKQEYEQASALSDQEFEQQVGLTRVEYGLMLDIQRDKQKFQGEQATAERRHETGTQTRQLASDAELAQMDADARKDLMQMEDDMRTRLAGLDADLQTQTSMGDMVTSMNSQYQNSINSILSNPNLGAEDRNDLLRSSGQLLNLQMDMTEGLFDVDLDWTAGTFDLSNPDANSADTKKTKKTKKRKKTKTVDTSTEPEVIREGDGGA